jgi:hypothetical protein
MNYSLVCYKPYKRRPTDGNVVVVLKLTYTITSCEVKLSVIYKKASSCILKDNNGFMAFYV